MDLFILLQDPGDDGSPTVLEEIAEATENATMGGGIFAFASPAGVQMLFGNEAFAEFVKHAPFDLVVGVDSITNEKALDLLKKRAADYPSLNVRAFFHSRAITFHPKFCWFTNAKHGRAIVGSGNLTPGGLFGNWEAFTIVDLDAMGAKTVQTQWAQWTALHAKDLRDLDDPDVRNRAKKNKSRIIRAPDAEDSAMANKASTGAADQVLVAEIPAAGTRWQQANFDLKHFTGFFHLKPGTKRSVVLYHIDAAGNVEPAEQRQSVSVKSKNYRIELAAAPNVPYPAAAPPISVFVRTGRRQFRYQVVMPGDPTYKYVDAILSKRWAGPPRFMRRVTLSATDLRAEWPGTPL
ncbi:phospholipase D family protein [Anaeromyxobacter sp. SG64]|uniref:phospholipase D family protein n=1 Tax=Anaeromyxobacter sp. SG64 TaxID=2925409 RepID=UPI001F56A4A8|nr:phospholipase D family protein [Anaeromyxobacter sp. SG64]